MDPALAGAVAVAANALAMLLLAVASYYFPKGYHRRGAVRDGDPDRDGPRASARRRADHHDDRDDDGGDDGR